MQNDIENDVEVTDINIHRVGDHNINQVERSQKRIRLINAAALDCPLYIFVNFIPFKLMSVDGKNIESIDVTSVLLYPGK